MWGDVGRYREVDLHRLLRVKVRVRARATATARARARARGVRA